MSSYWQTYHSDKTGNKDFIDGAIAAIEAYSVYRNGVREIGSPEQTVSYVTDKIKKDLKYPSDNLPSKNNEDKLSKLQQNIISRTNKIIHETLFLNSDIPYSPEMNLVEDLNADSLDTIELIVALETEFNIAVSDKQTESVETIEDIYTLIEKLLKVSK